MEEITRQRETEHVRGIEVFKWMIQKVWEVCRDVFLAIFSCPNYQISEDGHQRAVKIAGQLNDTFEGENPGAYLLKKDLQQRKEIIEKLAYDIQEGAGLAPYEVVFDELEPSIGGMCNDGQKRIYLNLKLLRTDDTEVLTILVHSAIHEIRHMMQFASLLEKGDYGYTKSQIQKMLYENLNYIDADMNPRGYRNQFIEEDAFGFSAYTMAYYQQQYQ